MTARADTSAGRPALAARLARAFPSARQAIAGALVWASAMAFSAAVALWLSQWQTAGHIGSIVLLFAAGGALAFPFALYGARLLAPLGGQPAFAAALLCLGLLTVLAVGGLYGLQYRMYYAQWHEAPFSRIWFLQFIFTVAAAQYQFAVLGLRLFFPVGFLALIAASLWFARTPR